MTIARSLACMSVYAIKLPMMRAAKAKKTRQERRWGNASLTSGIFNLLMAQTVWKRKEGRESRKDDNLFTPASYDSEKDRSACEERMSDAMEASMEVIPCYFNSASRDHENHTFIKKDQILTVHT